jgi:hypothetical protein
MQTEPVLPTSSDLRRWARELRLCFTAAGAMLAFDIAVFLLLALLAGGLLWSLHWPLDTGKLLMLAVALLFMAGWAGLSAPDWRRWRTLRRRWLALSPLPPRPVRRVATRVAGPAPAPRVRSACVPSRSGAVLRAQWAWRVGGH